MVEVKEFFSNGYLLSLLLFLVLVIMNTLLQAGNFLMIREGVRLRGALQVSFQSQHTGKFVIFVQENCIFAFCALCYVDQKIKASG